MSKKCAECGIVIDPAGSGVGKCDSCCQTESDERSQQEMNTKSSGSGGCFRSLVIAVIAGLVGIWGWGKLSDWRKGPDAVRKEKIEEIERKKKEVMLSLKDETDPFSEGASETKRDAAKKLTELENEKRSLLKEQAEAAKSAATPSGTSETKQAVPEPQILNSLEGVSLPKTVIVTESFNLLNEVGKETKIPVGAIIKIEKRGDKGSLTCQIDGTLFVGNEYRLFGKVKAR
jgi:hypothetical protein